MNMDKIIAGKIIAFLAGFSLALVLMFSGGVLDNKNAKETILVSEIHNEEDCANEEKRENIFNKNIFFVAILVAMPFILKCILEGEIEESLVLIIVEILIIIVIVFLL